MLIWILLYTIEVVSVGGIHFPLALFFSLYIYNIVLVNVPVQEYHFFSVGGALLCSFIEHPFSISWCMGIDCLVF